MAIQLSHNAIVGQDDLAILRELCDEIRTWVNRMADYDRFLDALTDAKAAAG